MEGKKIVAFLGETFIEKEGSHYSMPPNAKFLQMTFGDSNVKIISPSEVSQSIKSKPNSVVDSLRFYKAPLPSGCTTKEFYRRTIFQPGFYRDFCDYCDFVIANNPDAIFWARTPSPGGVIFAFRVIRANKKLIHHICGDARDTWKDNKYHGYTKILAFLFSKVVVIQLKKIISYSNVVNLTSGSRLFDFSSKYSNKTNQFLDVISNGNNQSELKEGELRKFNITFIGRIVDDKGIFELLLAFKRVIEVNGDGYHLTIIGGGPELEKVKAFIVDLAITEFVTIRGILDADEISQVLSKTKIVVIPSKTNEGFPRVIFESWSHSVPVIVSKIGGISAFVVDNDNALVVEPGSVDDIYHALIKCSDPALYSILRQGAIISKAISTQKYWSNELINIIEDGFDCDA